MERYYKKVRKVDSSSSSNEFNVSESVEQKEANSNSIKSDSGVEKPIEKFDVFIRDEVPTEYLTMGSETDVVYCARLPKVVDTVRFLLKQGMLYESTSSFNRDNFIALLDLCSELGNDISKVPSQNIPHNNQITSQRIQKELAHVCASEVILSIVNDIGDKVFTILIDEALDIASEIHLGVVLRYVNNKGCVVERFIATMMVLDARSHALKDAIDALFVQHNLSLSKLRGQCFNGAANLRDQLSELKSLILQENPYAMYTHCFSHQLQLIIIGVSGRVFVVNRLFTSVSTIVSTIGARSKCKDEIRQLEHERLVNELGGGEIQIETDGNQETSSVRPSDTRWGSYYLTLLRLCSTWQSVEKVLETVCDDGYYPEDRLAATHMLEKMYDYGFVFVLHLMKYLLGITNELSLSLQHKDQNVVQAVSLIHIVKSELQSFRKYGWELMLDQTSKFCELNDIPLIDLEDKIPRPGYKRHGAELITNLYYYRVEIFNKVVDITIEEINDRFSEVSVELLSCVACFDPRNSFSQLNVDQLMCFASLYPGDFSTLDCLLLPQQLSNFIVNVRLDPQFSSISNLGDLAQNMVTSGKHTTFPLVYRMIELALVLPVATPFVERAFSAMKKVKTNLGEREGDELMYDSLVVYIEDDIFPTIDNERILQRFQSMDARRSQLTPPPQTS